MAPAFSIRNQAYTFLVYVLLVLSVKIVTVEAVTSSLWDENDADSSLTNQQPDFTGLELGAIDPGQLVAYEANKRIGIFNDTLEFAKALKTCRAMVAAAYRLSSYVPHIQTQNQSDFWEGTVIKIVVQTLHQDVLARSLISKCFGRIRDLGVVIQNVYKIVKRSKGSKKGIELAKKYVPAALDKITDCIRSVEMLDSNVITRFAENTNTFISVIGKEAANFTKDKVIWDLHIQQARDTQQDLTTKLGVKRGEFERYHYLIAMTEKYVGQSEEEVQEAQTRIEELYRLNSEVEKAIKNIPQTVEQSETRKKGFGIGPLSVTWTESQTIQVPNPDREAQERYYSDVMKSRAARLEKMKTDKDAKRKAFEQLRNEVAEYKRDYNRTKTALEQFQETFETGFANAELAIKNALEGKRNISRKTSEINERIGLEGSILIEALEHVEVFSQSLNPAATAYSPFAAILNTIKTLVETHVELLSSDEPSDIFLAGTLLIEQARFLSDYVVGAQQILYSNDDYYNGIAIAKKPKQALLA